VLCIVFALVAAVGHEKNVPNIYLAATLTLVFMGHLWDFGDALYDLTTFFGDAAPIVPMLIAEPDVQDKADARDIGCSTGHIALHEVDFAYPNTDSNVFSKLSIDIASGERIGVVGRSGAGKSTLVKLVMRFIDVDDGSIMLDGHDIRDITQESLRANISYVSQEPMLFHRTVYENITYGVGEVSSEQVSDVLHRSHSNEFIEQLPKGLESIVGERGVNLSGGQRQRISIARAMLKNAPILILDEATSALDSESEGYVQAAFSELMQDRTTIVIAHRLSTLQNMSKIVVFDNGQIVEQGTHEKLVNAGGIYSSLWAHQAGGFISSE
jgi:ATP-binding cassette subfamily B protein